MRNVASKVLTGAVCVVAFAGFLVWTAHLKAVQQQPATGGTGQATTIAAPANDPEQRGQRQGRGRGAGGGGGGRGAASLGDGPWDFGSGADRVHVTVVTKGLDHPWGMAFLADGSMLVTERGGRLRVMRNGVLDPNPISGLPQIRAASLGGLLDIALHPKFPENRLIYFTYSKPGTEDPAKATLAV